MKSFTQTLVLAFSAMSATTSARAIEKRADAAEAASIGYATQNGGTTGGGSAAPTSVTTLSALQSCASKGGAVCIVSGTISGGATVKVASDTTILGADSKAILKGVGLTIKGVSNVIVRNLSIDKVLAENGDGIGINKATNVWIDHCDVQGDRTQGDKDKYDGLIDVTHAADWVSITNTFLHNHWKASLVGHSDNNGAEDKGHLTVTYANNYFYDINSRGPSFRFGTGHIINNYYEKLSDAINTRLGAQLLVESNQFVDVDKPLYAVDNDGYAVSNDNDFGSGENAAPAGKVTVPYKYTLLGSKNVKAAVVGSAGATLTF